MGPARFLLLVGLAGCFSCGLTDSSIRIVEDPVLIEFNATHTAIRCSVEVGLLSPRIDFFFDNVTISAAPFMRCNGVPYRPFTADNGHVASSCQKDASTRVRHQTVYVRTCFEGGSYHLNGTVVHCQPVSSQSAVALPTSRRVLLLYNDRQQPRIVPAPGEVQALRVPSVPVCPNEPVGRLDWWTSEESSSSSSSVVASPTPSRTSSAGLPVAGPSTPPDAAAATTVVVSPSSTTTTTSTTTASTSMVAAVQSSLVVPGINTAHTVFASAPDATPLDQIPTPSPPSQTPPSSPSSTVVSPSLSPTPVPPSGSEDLFSTLSEAQLRIIIFVAAGVAALFALIVLCLLCTLGCVLMRRRKTSTYKRSKKSIREALTEDGSKDDTIRLERITSPPAVNGQTRSSTSRQPQQFALHRGGSDSSSNTNSIRSDTLERDFPPDNSYDRPRNPVVDQNDSTVVAADDNNLGRSTQTPPQQNSTTDGGDVADHDYDYIDDSQLPPRPYQKSSKLSSSSFSSSGNSRGELKSAKALSENDYNVPRLSCIADGGEEVPGFPVAEVHMRESGVEVEQCVPAPSPTSRHSLAASDYQNTATVPAIAARTTPATGNYQNRAVTTSGTQTLQPGGAGDNYQELNSIDSDYTVGDSSSSSYFNHLDGFVRPNPYRKEATDSSLSGEKSNGASSSSKNAKNEPLYHTVLPSGSTESSDGSADSTGAYCLPPDVQARIRASGRAAQSQATTHHHPYHNSSANPQGGAKPSEQQHDYEDLDMEKLDGSEDYSTLTKEPAAAITTSISTQTYA